MFSQEELANRLQDIANKMYKGDPDNPYLSEKDGEVVEMSCAEVGVTTAVVSQLCRELECPVHVVWNSCKIKSYTPQRTAYETVCFEVRGDHAYFIGDSHTKQHIARGRLTEPVKSSSASNDGQVKGRLQRNGSPSTGYDQATFGREI